MMLSSILCSQKTLRASVQKLLYQQKLKIFKENERKFSDIRARLP